MHCLRIDADTRDAEIFHGGNFFGGDCVGATALNREFLDARAVEAVVNFGKQLREKFFGQRAGRASANVNRLHLQAVAGNGIRRRLDVAIEHRHKFGDFTIGGQDVRRERAI